jgi:hypothetical protein
LATRVAWPPVLVDDTIALKGGVDARYHSYLRQPLSSLARLAACIARKMARSFLRFLLARACGRPSDVKVRISSTYVVEKGKPLASPA